MFHIVQETDLLFLPPTPFKKKKKNRQYDCDSVLDCSAKFLIQIKIERSRT